MKLSKEDFACIGDVAKHCDWDKLCIAIEEAFTFDLMPLLCDNGMGVEANWCLSCDPDEVEEEEKQWQTILCGGTVQGCGDKQITVSGLRKILVYFAYSRYIIINNWNDTPTGAVTKTNDFSFPKDEKLLRMMANKYDTMARQLWKAQEGYLCTLGWSLNGCQPCGCNGVCGGYRNTKGFGINSDNITKYGVR